LECAADDVVVVASLYMQTMTTIMSEINMRPLGSPTTTTPLLEKLHI
jgi:hypothetical protein